MSIPVPSFDDLPGPVEVEARGMHATKLRQTEPGITDRQILDRWDALLPETRVRWLREAQDAMEKRLAIQGVPDDIEALRARLGHRSPYVSVNPAMRSGQPTINGTRLPVDAVAGMVWAEGVDVAVEEYDLTRADVLVACWYAGRYGLPGQREALFPVRLWPKRWGAWAAEVGPCLWAVTRVDYDAIPDPPTNRVHTNEDPTTPIPRAETGNGDRT